MKINWKQKLSATSILFLPRWCTGSVPAAVSCNLLFWHMPWKDGNIALHSVDSVLEPSHKHEESSQLQNGKKGLK